MVEIGQKVMCRPYDGLALLPSEAQNENVEATVTYVNKMNHWFQVEYSEYKLRTSFKFNDIGKRVKLI